MSYIEPAPILDHANPLDSMMERFRKAAEHLGLDDDIYNVLKKVHDKKISANFVNHPKSYPNDEPQRRCPDIKKANKDLNYKPKIQLENGLRKYHSWAKLNYKY